MRWLDGITHRLDEHESEQAPEVGDGQGGLACCSPWGRKESDMTEQLNCSFQLIQLNTKEYDSLPSVFNMLL